jgi:hypothetical protein
VSVSQGNEENIFPLLAGTEIKFQRHRACSYQLCRLSFFGSSNNNIIAERVGAYSTHRKERKNMKFWQGNLKERHHLEDL